METFLSKIFTTKAIRLKCLVLPHDDVRFVEPYGEVVAGNILDVAFLRREIRDVDVVFSFGWDRRNRL
ncbi:MAG: hypothetical protein MZU97_22280 [Bacillus subtilis]|nr:hypothetical protein [Bacillus subtilis]